jgi:hypothetical protein
VVLILSARLILSTNKKIVNFLDITLNLNTGLYSKPNNTPLYVHSKSNHPPSVLRNIPLSINFNKRLTEISSDQDPFEQASAPYQQALDKSGYNHKLQFKHPLNLTTNNKTRSRKEKLYGIIHHIVRMFRLMLASLS